MPKIPWTPPKRPPRIHVEDVIPPPPDNPCPTCLGKGVLYNGTVSSENERSCWVCKGTGQALPPPPEGDLHSDGSSIPWSGGSNTHSGNTHSLGVEHASPPTGECADIRCPDRQGGRHFHQGSANITWLD